MLLLESIDELDWYSAKEEGLGNLYEGLLEKNANEKKSGAGQYFTLDNNRCSRPDVFSEEDPITVSIFPDLAIDLKPVFMGIYKTEEVRIP